MEWWSVALGGPFLAGCWIVLVGSVVDGIQLVAERLRGRRERSEADDLASWGGSLLLVGFLAGAVAAGDATVAWWCGLPCWRAAAAGAGAGVVAGSALAWARWPRMSPWIAGALFFITNTIASWIALS
jgi:hypothetical protein